jgi:hypothetical protein
LHVRGDREMRKASMGILITVFLLGAGVFARGGQYDRGQYELGIINYPGPERNGGSFRAWVGDQKRRMEEANSQGSLTEGEYNDLTRELMAIQAMEELSREGRLSREDQRELAQRELELSAAISSAGENGRAGWIRQRG